jgi:hypothetical protein
VLRGRARREAREEGASVWAERRRRPLRQGCMAPIGRLLGTARIPQHGRDTLRFFPDTTHIVLMRANRFFRVDVLSQVLPGTLVKKLCVLPRTIVKKTLWRSQSLPHFLLSRTVDSTLVCSQQTHRARAQDGRMMLSIEALQRQIQHLIDTVPPVPDSAVGVGCLTMEDRDAWAAHRRVLEEHGGNRRVLSVVDSALLIVCLDAQAQPRPCSYTCFHAPRGVTFRSEKRRSVGAGGR